MRTQIILCAFYWIITFLKTLSPIPNTQMVIGLGCVELDNMSGRAQGDGLARRPLKSMWPCVAILGNKRR